jgi:hypothetical protein
MIAMDSATDKVNRCIFNAIEELQSISVRMDHPTSTSGKLAGAILECQQAISLMAATEWLTDREYALGERERSDRQNEEV